MIFYGFCKRIVLALKLKIGNNFTVVVKGNWPVKYEGAKMNDYKKKALVILKDFPESEYKSSLEAMIAYVVERKI